MKFFEKFIFFLVALIPFLPEFGVIDIIGVHFLYLSITQILIFGYIFFIKRVHLNFLKNKSIFFYLAFVALSFISIFWSFNKTEALIESIRFFTIFISFVNIYSLFMLNNFNKNLFYIVVFSLLTIESLYIFKIFLSNYSFQTPPSRLRVFQGLSYNQNIAAFSLLIKLPVVFYLVFKVNDIKFKTLIYSIIALSFFNILIIGSRGAILTSIAFCIILILSVFFKNFNHKNFRLNVIILLIIFGITSLVQGFLYTNNQDLVSSNRISNFNDESTNYRIAFFKNAAETIIKKPLTGVGIGNWKIQSIEGLKKTIKDYQIPYHTHNDFLQIGAEIGILGLIFYLLIFLYPAAVMLKRITQKHDDSILYLMLLCSIMVFVGDSMLNFPRARPFSQMNFIYLFGFIGLLIDRDLNKNNRIQYLNFLILILGILSIYIHNRVFISYRQQAYIINDFNFNPTNYQTPLEEVKYFEEDIPNISTVTFPLKVSKGTYYIQNEEYEKGIDLVKKGNIYNPNLGLMEYELAKIFLYKEQNLDSAYKYIKISNDKLPLNNAHNSIYQIILTKLNKIEESKKLFKSIKHLKEEILWQNFILFNTIYKYQNKIDFDQWDKEVIADAVKLFPQNSFFGESEKIINYGEGIILIANNFDSNARIAFEEKNFKDAIKNWEEAIKIIPNDKAYYYNIIQSYLNYEKPNLALEWLDKLEKSKIDISDGKFHFLKGLYFLSFKNKLKACEFFRISNELNYVDAKNALQKIGCNY